MSETSVHHSFPASQALQLVELARRWGVEPEALLGPFGLELSALERPDARVTLEAVVGLTSRTRDLTGEPGLGVYLGLQKHVSAYGFVGFAAMSAATLREAMEQATEFAPALSTAIGLGLSVEGDTAALVVHEHADVSPIRDVALLSLFVGLLQMAGDLTGRAPVGLSVELSIPRPDYFDRFEHVLPGARFGQPLNQILFPTAFLDVPLSRPNRAALNMAREQCQAQLARLGFDGTLPGQVRRAMVTPGGFLGVEQVASRLGVSERTLKRRLATHGVTFSDLLQEERKLGALQLLRATELTQEEIAERLGYANPSSFARAFMRWTGETPAAYRKALPTSGVLLTPKG